MHFFRNKSRRVHAQVSSCDLYQTDKALFPSFRLMGRESTPPSHVTLCFTVCEGKTVFPLWSWYEIPAWLRQPQIPKRLNTCQTGYHTPAGCIRHILRIVWTCIIMYITTTIINDSWLLRLNVWFKFTIIIIITMVSSPASFPVHLTVHTKNDFSLRRKTKRSKEKIVRGIKKQFIILSFHWRDK